MPIMKEAGPVSPAKFNKKMFEYSAPINAQPFELSQLVLTKVNYDQHPLANIQTLSLTFLLVCHL